MRFDKVVYLKEFIKCITNERYEPHDLLTDFARGEYGLKKEEHKEEQKENKKRKAELKKTIAKKKGKNIDKELEEYRNLIKKTKFPDFEAWWTDSKNADFVSTFFWDEFQMDITENFDFGTINLFNIQDTSRRWIVNFSDDYSFEIKGLVGNLIETREGVFVDIKTGKISFEEGVEINENIGLLKKWIEWKEDKEIIDKVFGVLEDYIGLMFIKEEDDKYIVIEHGRSSFKIYKKRWKIVFRLDKEEFLDKKDLKEVKSCRDKNSYLVNQL